jgi:hypothetical protein
MSRLDGASEWPVSHNQILGVLLEFGDKEKVVVDLATASMADV